MPVVKKEHESSYGNFVICDRQGEYSENLLKVLRDSFPYMKRSMTGISGRARENSPGMTGHGPLRKMK